MCHNDRSQGRNDILNDLFCFPFDTAVLVLRLESFLEISLADTQWSWRGWSSRPGWFEIPACLNTFHKFVSTWNWMAGIWRIDQWIWGIHHVCACWTNLRNQWLFIHAKKIQEMVQSLVAQAVVGAQGKSMDGKLAGAWFRDAVYPAHLFQHLARTETWPYIHSFNYVHSYN